MKKFRNLVAIIGMMALVNYNLNAAVTVEKVWTSEDTSVVPGETARFAQLRISTDEAVSLESIDVESEMGDKVFSHLAIRNGFGRVIGRAPASNVITTTVPLERTILLPDAPLYVEIEGEAFAVFAANVLGRNVTISARNLNIGGNPVSIKKSVGTGATHVITNGKVGRIIFVGKLGTPSQVSVGPMKFLGGFLVAPDATEEIRALVNIGLHTTGGNGDDIQNLRAAIITPNGWLLMNLYRTWENDVRGDNVLGDYIGFLANSSTFIGIFGDVGESFSKGGTIALSTTPRDWRSVYGQKSGKSPLLQTGTVVGQTVKVTPSQRFDPGTGMPIPPITPPTVTTTPPPSEP